MAERRDKPEPPRVDRRISSNRRAFPRWSAEFEVRYAAGKKMLEGKPIEIGEGGLSFFANEPIPLETELTIEFRLGGETDWVKTKSVVRHSDQNQVGAEFLNLRRADRLRIVDFITEKK